MDGFHTQNVGKLYIGDNTFVPCAPKGIIRILEEIGLENPQGKKAVVWEEVRQADIVVSAMGQAKLVKKEWLKQGTVVIDVEMNRDKNGKLCGDVELNDVMEKVSYITPVSKGDGFVTRAMLLENIMQAYSGKMNK